MDDELCKLLLADGVAFVRWAFAGSNDDGGIVEIKIYNANQAEIGEIAIYSDGLYSGKLSEQLLQRGSWLLNEKSLTGFEVGDGGYGWMLWSVEKNEVWVINDYNGQGMEAAFFDESEYDRLEISIPNGWSDGEPDYAQVSTRVVFCGQWERESFDLDEDQVRNFLRINKIIGKKKRGDFFAAGGYLEFKVSGAALINVLSSIGINSNNNLYYKTETEFSRTKEETLDELLIEVSDSDPRDPLAIIFIDGWQETFAYKMIDEQGVIERNPAPNQFQSSEC